MVEVRQLTLHSQVLYQMSGLQLKYDVFRDSNIANYAL